MNEISDGVIQKTGDVVLVSKSYLIERDERELMLLKEIEKLRIQKP